MSNYVLTFCLIFSIGLNAQVTSILADFDDDPLGGRPVTVIGSANHPSELFGETSELTISEFTGDQGNSTASGRVVTIDVPAANTYRLIDFDGQSISGIVTEGIVRVSFDFIAQGTDNDGFAFLRNYDNAQGNPESFADVGFAFSESSYSIGPLNYDPSTGNYLGWPSAGEFTYGVWYNFEALINLDDNTLRLLVDGVDAGLETGISRATGDGYRGSFINWGNAFAGRCSIDNFKVIVPATTGLPGPPQGFLDLLNNVPNYGGQVIRVPEGDFRTPGLDWESSFNAQLISTPVYDGITTYRLQITEGMDEADTRLFAAGRFPIKHNHIYEVSALIRTDFPRATWEISVGINGAPAVGESALGTRYGGMPARTQGPDGWERWTWRFVPHWDARYTYAETGLTFHEYGPGFDGNVNFEIADLAFVELPAQPLVPFEPGEGVTFDGGAGDLPMFVEGITGSGNKITVTSTSAHYHFDVGAGTLEIDQRIEHKRTLTRLADLPLSGLQLQQQDADAAVLVGSDITIGVQCDGTIVLSPHAAMEPELTSVIGGDFNRLEAGDLVCRDDFGGFTASIHTPRGSGRRTQIIPITPALPFVGLAGDDLTTFAPADTGWQVSLPTLPGERLFISAAPSRPYDWEKSFGFEWGIGDYNNDLDYYTDPAYMTDWILWNFNQRGWAMSQGTDYVIRDDIQAQSHFDAVTDSGKKWAAYFSQWFYYSRDPVEWVGAIQAWRDNYGMQAMYSDGLAQDDWLAAYKAMRLMRGQVFPDGDIIIHDSYPQSGVPTAQYKPAIYAYATGTYMGENAVVPVGADWAWARYGMNMYRGGNAFGVTKGDGWTLGNSVDKYLIGLVWGGRGRPDVAEYDSRYRTALLALRTLWETYGDDPFFYDRYYHPEAQELTGYNIGRAGMPIIDLDTLSNGDITVALSSWSPGAVVRYTTDGSDPTSASTLFENVITVNGELRLRARAYRTDLEESARAEINIVTGALPVGWTFVSATATDDCNHVEVRWQTSYEESVASFVVERNDHSGEGWQVISASILPNREAYVHTDKYDPNGNISYRIRQMDFDGTVNYSPVVVGTAGSCREERIAAIFPNPTDDRLTVIGTSELSVPYTIVDAFGRKLLSGFIANSRTDIVVSELPAGVYWLIADGLGKRFIKK